MTNDQVRRVIVKYREHLNGLGFIPKNYSNDHRTSSVSVYRLRHICWMCDEVENMLDHNVDTEKVHRWFGFIQGVLCADGIYSIEEMREHNRAEGEKV